jgi:hypothetical protein
LSARMDEMAGRELGHLHLHAEISAGLSARLARRKVRKQAAVIAESIGQIELVTDVEQSPVLPILLRQHGSDAGLILCRLRLAIGVEHVRAKMGSGATDPRAAMDLCQPFRLA